MTVVRQSLHIIEIMGLRLINEADYLQSWYLITVLVDGWFQSSPKISIRAQKDVPSLKVWEVPIRKTLVYA